MRIGIATGFGTMGDPSEVAAVVGHIEGLGFESVWVTEHVVLPVDHRSRYPYTSDGRLPIGSDADLPDPLVWLAFAAARTTTLVLGTACVVLPQRNPLVLAKEAATLDRLSAGRFRLGVGLGWLREEAEAVGSVWEGRAARAEEAVAAMRAAWTSAPGAPVSFSGPTVGFADVQSLPAPGKGRVPVVICGRSASAAERAGRIGDGWFSNIRDRDELAARLAALRGAAEAAGRDVAGIEISAGTAPHPRALAELEALGVDRAVLTVPGRGLDRTRALLDKLATLLP